MKLKMLEEVRRFGLIVFLIMKHTHIKDLEHETSH